VIREIVNEMRDEAEGGESNNVSFSWGDKFMRIVCIFDTFLCTEIEQPTTLLLLYTVSLSLSLLNECKPTRMMMMLIILYIFYMNGIECRFFKNKII
jgi:hypothetical protein